MTDQSKLEVATGGIVSKESLVTVGIYETEEVILPLKEVNVIKFDEPITPYLCEVVKEYYPKLIKVGFNNSEASKIISYYLRDKT